MVIAEMMIDGARIRVHDDCMAKTEEENQKILERVTALAAGFYKSGELEQLKEKADKSA